VRVYPSEPERSGRSWREHLAISTVEEAAELDEDVSEVVVPGDQGAHAHHVRQKHTEDQAEGSDVMDNHLPEVGASLLQEQMLKGREQMVAVSEEDIGMDAFWSMLGEAPLIDSKNVGFGVLTAEVPGKPNGVFKEVVPPHSRHDVEGSAVEVAGGLLRVDLMQGWGLLGLAPDSHLWFEN